ncbi:type V CRISPR-associated protein Cas12k [Acaryochloris marina]|uniref:type V CRISPR-associated protein Cas12k n=1 Tax=Acaryochloris marina TaxID=155978 RepID=UPI001BB037C7|nr:type V CRISPR-associated protein Cas12k [Acaryochloris marina]QUY40675.1 type V CRISPR-associated protein Cas12k [Acaryochloris marina S15]
MTVRTIECALSAPEETRKLLWNWSVQYTLLVKELMEQIARDQRFPKWMLKGEVPQTIIDKDFLASLKLESQYAGLPNLFYVSARHAISQVYKSWFAIQKQSFFRLQNKQRWLNIVEKVLAGKKTQQTHEEICTRAEQWLALVETQAKQGGIKKHQRFGQLMREAETQTEKLDQLAIAYLLLNQLEIPEKPFKPKKLKQRFTKKRIEIERLETKVNAQLPEGRDPLGVTYFESLERAISLPEIPEDSNQLQAEWEMWRKQVQIPEDNPLPYPLIIMSCDKVYWPRIERNTDQTPRRLTKQSKQPQLGVAFSGFKEYVFRIQCGKKQLPIFRRFQEDSTFIRQQIKACKKHPEIIPPSWGVFPLRSGQLLWRPSNKHKDASQPWQRHRLYLHCTIDERLLSDEGTGQVCSEKLPATKENLLRSQKKTAQTQDKNQSIFQKRQQSSHLRLSQGKICRPYTVPYIGNPNLVLGVSLSRQFPLQAAIINVSTQKQIATCTAQQLLQLHWGGKSQSGFSSKQNNQNASLIERLQRERVLVRKARQKKQSKGKVLRSQKIERLGIYADRVIARRLVDWAISHRVGTIVLPKVEGLKESIEANLQAKARIKFPHYKALQQRYAKSIRAKYPLWSFSRLIQSISECANRNGIEVKTVLPIETDDPAEQAVAMALQVD